MRRLIVLAAAAHGAAAAAAQQPVDPCLGGLVYAFDGFRACALDEAMPCAVKAIEGPDWSISMEQCTSLCDASCSAVSLFKGRECWIYASLSGADIAVDGSIFCVRPSPPPPPDPPPPPQPLQTESTPGALAPVDDYSGLMEQQQPSWSQPPTGAASAAGGLGALAGALSSGTVMGLPTQALVSVAIGSAIGVALLLAGCMLMRPSSKRRRRRAVASSAFDDESPDEAGFSSEDAARARPPRRQAPAPSGRGRARGAPGTATPAGRGRGSAGGVSVQRVLVEALGAVSTVRVTTVRSLVGFIYRRIYRGDFRD